MDAACCLPTEYTVEAVESSFDFKTSLLLLLFFKGSTMDWWIALSLFSVL